MTKKMQHKEAYLWYNISYCIEAGMMPKTLQKILGHSNIGITMNLYVHITEDEKHKEIELVAGALKVI